MLTNFAMKHNLKYIFEYQYLNEEFVVIIKYCKMCVLDDKIATVSKPCLTLNK